MKSLFYFIVLLILCDPVMAQETVTNPKAKEQMRKFAKMEGIWKGSGFMIMPGGVREEFNQYEVARLVLDGTAILFEGRATDINDSSKVSHRALGIFYYDIDREGYFLDAHLSLGRHTKAKARDDAEGRLIWWFETPAGDTIKYIIEVRNNRWIEDGFYIKKGTEQERSFFHMELTKQNVL